MASEPKVGDVRTSDQLIYYVCIGNDFVPCSREQSDRLSAELSAAREMREVLREVEWSASEYHEGDATCPDCGQHEPSSRLIDRSMVGHAPDCRLARLIGGDRG